MLLNPDRHEPLANLAWNESQVRQKIVTIVDEADRAYQPEQFWPYHPMDEDSRPAGPALSLFWGASSAAWTLLTFKELGLTQKLSHDYVQVLFDVLDRYQDQPDTDSVASGYLFGECGLLTALHRFAPSPQIEAAWKSAMIATLPLPELELMWAAPGAMIAALYAFEKTKAPAWKQIFLRGAEHLIAEWKFDETIGARIWNQKLYGNERRYLGAVHGFCGNVRALLGGLHHLEPAAQDLVLKETANTLLKTALRSPGLANWKPHLDSAQDAILVQWCHGAPGILTSLAEHFPSGTSPELETLLHDAGNLTWKAGPLKKPLGLCHGTAGNGYAFLKLFRRTQDSLWLERARSFAMHALWQSDQQFKVYGRHRYCLFNGDLGLACYLWSCLESESRWPLIDWI